MVHFNNLSQDENLLANQVLEKVEKYYEEEDNNYEDFTNFFNLFVKLCNKHNININQFKKEL